MRWNLKRYFQERAEAKALKIKQKAEADAQKQAEELQTKTYIKLCADLSQAIKNKDQEFINTNISRLLYNNGQTYRPYLVGGVLKTAIEENDHANFKRIFEFVKLEPNCHKLYVREEGNWGYGYSWETIYPLITYAITRDAEEIALYLASYPDIDFEICGKKTIFNSGSVDHETLPSPIEVARKKDMKDVLQALLTRKLAFIQKEINAVSQTPADPVPSPV